MLIFIGARPVLDCRPVEFQCVVKFIDKLLINVLVRLEEAELLRIVQELKSYHFGVIDSLDSGQAEYGRPVGFGVIEIVLAKISRYFIEAFS